jgi:hypothetical protein
MGIIAFPALQTPTYIEEVACRTKRIVVSTLEALTVSVAEWDIFSMSQLRPAYPEVISK